MAQLRRLLLRLYNVVFPARSEPDLARELASHLTLMEEDLQRHGMTSDEARLAARRAFGGVEQTKEHHRDTRSFVWLDDVRRDVAYALRTARRSPGFALLGVAVLALGIGANTAVFSVVNTVLLKPLPYQDPDRIVTLTTDLVRDVGPIRGNIADADFQDWRSQATTFEAMAYFQGGATAVVVGEQAEYTRLTRVSDDFFRVFGVRPIVGRLFGPEELRSGPPSAAIVSSIFAQSHFGGSGHAVGTLFRHVRSFLG